jgi:hypothetical protein
MSNFSLETASAAISLDYIVEDLYPEHSDAFMEAFRSSELKEIFEFAITNLGVIDPPDNTLIVLKRRS